MTSLLAIYLFGYVELLRFLRIDREYLFCVFCKARQRTVNPTGSKMKCVEHCDFHFCCALIFCQPMKKFEFFGASRATRQRHFKTSSTGDENGAEEIPDQLELSNCNVKPATCVTGSPFKLCKTTQPLFVLTVLLYCRPTLNLH